jgi:OOP family OmpA-OmpF porin
MGLAAFAVIAGSPAIAEDPGWYLGAGVGRSKAKIDDAQITNGLLAAGIATTGIADRNRDTGYKVFTGYQFSRYFAVEGGFFDLGRFGFTANTLPPGALNGNITLRGFNTDAVGFVPITSKFSAFGRAGLALAEARDSFTGSGLVGVVTPYAHKNQINYKFGGGLQYDITRCLAVRTEVERYRVDDAVGNKGDIDLFSAGLLVRFGHKAAPVMVAAAAPVTIYPAPAPAPVLVVVPVAAATQQYCTILDVEFNIDKDDIQPVDRENLKVLGTFLAKYPDTTAVIEGHSDNVGSDEHNLILSKHRAESVVAYLVDDLHIDHSRLTAVGYGNTRPVADNATEEGKRQNRRVDAVVACVTDVEGLPVAPARLTMALFIDFDQNQADIKPEFDRELRKVSVLLKANPGITATVEGHTGNLKATPAQQMEISRRRAQNVVDYLVNTLGVSHERLTAEGFGDLRRFAYNTSAEGEQENRRVNIIFHYPK